MPGLDFSFSGLKTSILHFLKRETANDSNFIATHLDDICASIQGTIVAILLKKLRKASHETGIRHIAIAGGVSANSGLREGLQNMGEQEGWTTYIPAFQYCTDNAGMIGISAYYKYLAGEFCGQEVVPYARQS